MKIFFTKHSLYKLSNIKIFGIKINKRLLIGTIENPDDVNQDEDYPNLIASAKLDSKRILRVIYRIEKRKIIIITFYPAKKGRYY